MIALYLALGVVALLLAAGYFIFVRPWTNLTREYERARRDREPGL